MKHKFIFGLSALLLMSCNLMGKKESETEKVTQETVEVEALKFQLEAKSESGAEGTVSFTEENGSVRLSANLSNLSPGVHAIHLHEKADCSSEDGKSTGGHWNPTFEQHGSWGSDQGFHRGDIGNFSVDENGNATVEFETDLWCLTCDDETKNIKGKAVIVHQGEDDLISQPSGAAGSRIICGAIIE
jgi:Cu-Zn family superoxide dismutase